MVESLLESKTNDQDTPLILEKKYAYSVPTSVHSTWMKTQQYLYPKATDVFGEKNISLNIELKELQPITKQSEENQVAKKRLASMKSSRRNTLSENFVRPYNIARSNLPVKRDDLFLFGSLNKLHKYRSQTSIAYHVSVTHLEKEPNLLSKVSKIIILVSFVFIVFLLF